MPNTNFAHMLRAGLGRAISFLGQHDGPAYRAAILNACLHNVAFDRQLEGSRVDYLFDVMQASGESDYYTIRIVEELKTFVSADDDDWDWDLVQLFDLNVALARRGNMAARTAIYNRFDTAPSLADNCGASALIALDGLDGFIYVAERIGREILASDSNLVAASERFWANNRLVSLLEDSIGEGEAAAAMARLRTENVTISAFLAIFDSDRLQNELCESAPSLALSYPDFRRFFVDPAFNNKPYVFKNWARQASDDDIRQAAADFLVESDRSQLIKYLYIFSRRAFPLDPTKMIALAQQADTSQATPQRLSHWAFRALENITHPAVRTFAVELLTRLGKPGYAAGLFKQNFEPGDWLLLAPLVDRMLDGDDFHWLGIDLLDVFDLQPDPAQIAVLLKIYDRGCCSRCRLAAIKQLSKLNAIPEWLSAEAIYDSSFDIRDFFAK